MDDRLPLGFVPIAPWPPAAPPRPGSREYAVSAALFTATAASVYMAGHALRGAAGGLQLVAGLLSILFAHEMGHYVACRLYLVDASLPFFLPCPWIPLGPVWIPLSFVGTFGAFIRIRAPIPDRRALFDIGIAGPLAGFAVTIPVLVLGILQAEVVPVGPADQGLYLGEPLLFQAAAAWLRDPAPDGFVLALGPLGLAAWFGLFVTALNLIPIGQLDGGHVSYALLTRRAHALSHVVWWACLLMTWFGPNWLVWAVLVRVLGRRHPRTSDDAVPLGRERVAVGVLGMVVLALCFTPSPIVWSWAGTLDWLFSLVRPFTSR